MTTSPMHRRVSFHRLSDFTWRPGQIEDASPAQMQGARQRWALHRVEGRGGRLSIIEADSRDEALRIASMHSAATLGEEGRQAVELIPVDFYLAR